MTCKVHLTSDYNMVARISHCLPKPIEVPRYTQNPVAEQFVIHTDTTRTHAWLCWKGQLYCFLYMTFLLSCIYASVLGGHIEDFNMWLSVAGTCHIITLVCGAFVIFKWRELQGQN